MTTQAEKAALFTALHARGNPLILFNIWDAGSAKAIQASGASALATGSWSVAAAHGVADGQDLALELALANLERIVQSVDLPVTIDFEGGYGETPDEVAAAVRRALLAGAVGINFEDQVMGGSGRHPIEAQQARIRAIRAMAEAEGVPLFINARTDVFLQAPAAEHNDTLLAEAIERATAYAEAGGSGFFAPGLADAAMIERLCAASPLPVNIMASPATPPTKILADAGVARISHGPFPYRQMMQALTDAGRAALRVE